MLEQPTSTIDQSPPTTVPSAETAEPTVEARENLRDLRFVEFYEVVKAYPNPYGDDFVVIDGFNFIMRRGEVVSVIGHSGCGKSTVLTMLAGLNDITSGGIVVDGREIDGPGPDRSVVFQAPCLLPWMTAFQNVMLGVDRVYAAATKAERRQVAEYYLSVVGLADSMHRYPRELSGGMQQRVGIARAIALKPKTLLLDEPFGRLDSLTRMELQDVILDILDRERVTTVLVTHDVDEAIYMADRVCMMTNGPRATVGQVLDIPFERPRNRREVLEHPDFYDLRGALLGFLEGQEKRKASADGASASKLTVPSDVSLQETKADIVAVPPHPETGVAVAGGLVSEQHQPLVRVVEVWQPAEDGSGLRLVEGHYRDVPGFEESSKGIAFDEGDGLPGAVWKSGLPVVFDDLDRDDFLRRDAATASGLTAGVGFPVFDDGEIRSVVLMLTAGLGTAKGAIESWLPEAERRELHLGTAHYANLERFEKLSRYACFPTGSGLPGRVWEGGRPVLETDLLNSPGFIRSSGAEVDGLGTALGIPLFARPRELRSVLVFLSSSDRPTARAQLVWNVDEAGAVTLESAATETCPWTSAALAEQDFQPSEGFVARVVEDRTARFSTDLSADWSGLATAAQRDGLHWALGIPVVADGRVVSVCTLLD